ncbi:hypothetical protein EOI86_08135 [Hwanghaeella grinnelliae]|uniref:Uncharacterized protein n=1 Tax=Hwanghaeella grinnelliae TaxID=2500179 RepID=A0A3S2ZAD0_9PROT|nr:hypothetical protein [Hwanghaeella grinnelliae]RVU39204.1 hypothetical protein EOI86_08135 [Hwanghaeella grinnelliae]
MTAEFKGQVYTYLVGSDVSRDGMYLELGSGSDGANTIAEIFYSDITHEMTVTLYKPDLPLEVLEWAISEARDRLSVSKELNK